jgi:hypothetical protein
MPKRRRVVLTLEVETDLHLAVLRKAHNLVILAYPSADDERQIDIAVIQSQANVVDD